MANLLTLQLDFKRVNEVGLTIKIDATIIIKTKVIRQMQRLSVGVKARRLQMYVEIAL